MFFQIKRGYRDRGLIHGDVEPELGIDGYTWRLSETIEMIIRTKGEGMGYSQLKKYMTEFHLGIITKTEMALAIHLWQRGGACST
jgi:hypothetical protein